jgi:hypothetical protein
VTKRFELRTILSVITGRLLTKRKGLNNNGIGDLYEILGWMTNDSPFTHQIPRFIDECAPWLLRWYPALQTATDALPLLDADIEREGAQQGVELWLGKLALMGLPQSFEIPRIPADDHTTKDPFDELVEMRGTDEGIVIVQPEQ